MQLAASDLEFHEARALLGRPIFFVHLLRPYHDGGIVPPNHGAHDAQTQEHRFIVLRPSRAHRHIVVHPGANGTPEAMLRDRQAVDKGISGLELVETPEGHRQLLLRFAGRCRGRRHGKKAAQNRLCEQALHLSFSRVATAEGLCS